MTDGGTTDTFTLRFENGKSTSFQNASGEYSAASVAKVFNSWPLESMQSLLSLFNPGTTMDMIRADQRGQLFMSLDMLGDKQDVFDDVCGGAANVRDVLPFSINVFGFIFVWFFSMIYTRHKGRRVGTYEFNDVPKSKFYPSVDDAPREIVCKE